MRIPAILILAAGSVTTVHAQSRTDTGPADSAAVARAAYAAASKAYGAGNMTQAHELMQRAANAWPTQTAYLWGTTITSARAQDLPGVLDGLRRYIRAGLGRSLSDTIFDRFRGDSAFRRLSAVVESNVAPLVRSSVLARMSDSTFWPEGVDYDPASRSFFLASIRHRTIAELQSDGTVRELWPRGRRDIGSVMGVRVDTLRRVLWATTSPTGQMEGAMDADTARSALLRIRIADGAIERRWSIPPSPNGHALGDLAIGPQGDVFMTDSNDPVLYRLRPKADTLERLTSPLFRSLQGMAQSADGRFLYVADYSIGLLQIRLENGHVRRLVDAPESSSLGCDGILLDRSGAIIAIQNGVSPARVMRFEIDAESARISSATVLDRNFAIADEPTIATMANGVVVYVANSQWEKYDEKGARLKNVALTAPVLLGIPFAEPPVRH